MQFSCICFWIPVGNQLGISWDVNFVYFIWKSVGNLLGCEFSCICFWNQLGICWNVNFVYLLLESVGSLLGCEFSCICFWNQLECNFHVFAFGFQLGIS